MSIELSLIATLSPLVGGRLYPHVLPLNTTKPAMVYARISAVPVPLLYRDTGGTEVHIQVDIYAAQLADLRALVIEVRQALSDAAYVVRLDDEQDLFEEDTRLFRALLDLYLYEPSEVT